MSARAGLPVVAIVGRPNVGKSALFNRLIGRRVAIVEDVPGVTRDRLYAETAWRERRFVLVDTGGLISDATEGLAARIRAQATRAAAEADVVLLVVDARDGLVPEDHAVAEVVRRAGAPVLVVANKVDGPARDPAVGEFFALGFGDPLPVSALHGRGVGDLLDAVVALLPPAAPADAPAAAAPAVAIVGRPNVGKSSLVNAILGEERVVVDAAPGTTRDAVDTVLARDGQRLVLIDTAGLRRPSRVREAVEAYGVARTRRAIARAQVAVLVLDAAEPVADQDQHIARQIADAGRGLVIALNKWDLVAATPRRDPQRERAVRHALRFVPYAPLVVTSAVRGWGIGTLLTTVEQVAAAYRARIPTGVLNRIVGEAVRRMQPPADAAGRRLRIYYATQPESAPPRVVLFVNEPERMSEAYLRYLERAIRRAYPLPGVPLHIVLRRRGEAP